MHNDKIKNEKTIEDTKKKTNAAADRKADIDKSDAKLVFAYLSFQGFCIYLLTYFIAMVGMMPVLVLQIMGVVYNIKIYGIKKNKYKVALRIAYGADKYSNMDRLEARHKKLMELKAKNGEE